jgi:hypothetical protein
MDPREQMARAWVANLETVREGGLPAEREKGLECFYTNLRAYLGVVRRMVAAVVAHSDGSAEGLRLAIDAAVSRKAARLKRMARRVQASMLAGPPQLALLAVNPLGLKARTLCQRVIEVFDGSTTVLATREAAVAALSALTSDCCRSGDLPALCAAAMVALDALATAAAGAQSMSDLCAECMQCYNEIRRQIPRDESQANYDATLRPGWASLKAQDARTACRAQIEIDQRLEFSMLTAESMMVESARFDCCAVGDASYLLFRALRNYDLTEGRAKLVLGELWVEMQTAATEITQLLQHCIVDASSTGGASSTGAATVPAGDVTGEAAQAENIVRVLGVVLSAVARAVAGDIPWTVVPTPALVSIWRQVGLAAGHIQEPTPMNDTLRKVGDIATTVFEAAGRNSWALETTKAPFDAAKACIAELPDRLRRAIRNASCLIGPETVFDIAMLKKWRAVTALDDGALVSDAQAALRVAAAAATKAEAAAVAAAARVAKAAAASADRRKARRVARRITAQKALHDAAAAVQAPTSLRGTPHRTLSP